MKLTTDKKIENFKELEAEIFALYQQVKNVQNSEAFPQLSDRERILLNSIQECVDRYYETKLDATA